MKLELPKDLEAERVIVGTAVDSPLAAGFVADLEPADFTVAVHRRLWRAAVACQLPYRYGGSRSRAIAEAAGVAFEVAEELRQAIPLLDDRSKYYSRRLREATRRRRLLAELAELHDLLAAGGELDEAMAGLERAWSIGAGEVVGVLAGPEALAR